MILVVAGVITASESSRTAPFTGLSPRAFGQLAAQLRREGVAPGRGRPWKLSPEDRVLLVAAYGWTNLTMRQLTPLFGVSKSAADRVIDHLGPLPAFWPPQRFAKDAVLIVDGTLVSTRDHKVAEQSENYRYSTTHQVVIDAGSRLVVAVGRPLPGNRHDCRARAESGARASVGNTTTIAGGGYAGTGLVMPHRRPGEELPDWKQVHNKIAQAGPRPRRALLRPHEDGRSSRDCRLRGDGVHHAMLGIAPPHTTLLSRDSSCRIGDLRGPRETAPHLAAWRSFRRGRTRCPRCPAS